MSKHVRKILPLLLCLLLMACLLPAAYADGESGMVLPSEIVVPPTRSDISFQHITCNYRLKSDGVLDLYADGYTVCCFYNGDNNSFSGCNVLWYSADGTYGYQLYSGNEKLSTILGYWGSYGNYQYSFDMDNNVIGVTYFANDGTAYNWNPPQAGQPDLGWYYNDPDNNWQPVYVTLDIERNTALIPPSDFSFNGSTETFWVETPMVNTSLQGLKDAIANNEPAYTLTASAALDEELVIPEGMHVTVTETLFITSEGKLTNNGVINLGTSGVLRIEGVFQGNPGSRIEVLNADLANIRPRVIIENGGEFNGMGGVMISQSILDVVDRSAIIYGADLSQWCDAVDKDKGPGYFPGKDIVPEIFVGMCKSGQFSQIRLRGTGNLSLTDNLTIPEGVYLKVRNDSRLIVPAGKTLTINGKIEASFNGRIDVLGTLQNNGEIEMFDGGVVDVKGTYAHADGRPITFNRDGRQDAAMPKFIVEQGAVYTLNIFRTDEGLVAADVLEGINPNTYSCHSNYDRDKHVIREMRIYYPSSRAGIEDMANRALGYIEIHGLDTYTLSTDVEIPVFDGTTPARVDMSGTTLVVPSGRTLTVNGELIVMALVNDGGTVVIGDGGSISYAERVEVTTLAQLKAALNANISRIIVTQNIALDADLTIPESCYVKVRHDSTLTVPAGKTLTINGKLEASFNGRIDVLGTLQNNGEIEMFDGGVVDVKGTYAHADGRPITFNRDGRQDAAMPKFIVEQGAVYTLNIFRTDEGLVAADVLEGINPNTYSCHSNYDRDKHVIREMRIYYPSSRAGIEDMANRALGYIEIHGLDTYTLSTDVEIPVFDTTPARVDMSETTLVVPSGRTLTVNGELKVNALVIQPGGSVTLAAGGKLTTSAQSADLTLPAALTTIESEAFSGGAFTSVYIPASVTSIASDAFGTRTDLTIYGTIGSQAQTFARNRFTFVALAPAA